MENIVLIIHLLLALGLIVVVLLQRNEGGGLGMGGGGGAVSSRGVATALHKLTWIFAVAFIFTSITLTIFAAQNSAGRSVLDGLGTPAQTDGGTPALPNAGDLLPPAAGDNPLLPPPVE